MVGIAVNVTPVPVQIAPDGLAEMLTLAINIGLTIMLIEFDVSGELITQSALLVMIHVIVLPFTKEDEEYVELVSPEIFAPLFCH